MGGHPVAGKCLGQAHLTKSMENIIKLRLAVQGKLVSKYFRFKGTLWWDFISLIFYIKFKGVEETLCLIISFWVCFKILTTWGQTFPQLHPPVPCPTELIELNYLTFLSHSLFRIGSTEERERSQEIGPAKELGKGDFLLRTKPMECIKSALFITQKIGYFNKKKI